ncbi:putative aarF domain-containing kinase 1 isoform X1 [Labeo rohita]|uniref:AarF domain-containing protein kinase 1 n=1 Tax=Labeo rohita TaxID=84645 RepID=A0A498LQA0_LABRO|nr:putative aarF domain-containing kinase 1 isoform X1 [Labeo rohita]
MRPHLEHKRLSFVRVHRRSAERLLDLCCANRGTFIKVGQHLGALDYLLPEEYTSTLKILHSRAPQSSMEEIRQVIREDLGKECESGVCRKNDSTICPLGSEEKTLLHCSVVRYTMLSDLFIQFEEKPQGAASLAQVHKAVLPDGRTVAVKVVHWLFPDFAFMWLVEEAKKNMPLELDFLNEGRNAEKIADMLKQFKFLQIPKIHWDLSTKRILTMDFAEGGQVNDREYMRKHGINVNEILKERKSFRRFSIALIVLLCHNDMIFTRPAEEVHMESFYSVSRAPVGVIASSLLKKIQSSATRQASCVQISWNLGKIYSEMIFVNGFVHCDPHPGNVLVRKCPKSNKTEIVLLDHGLYQVLNQEFRLDYCRLWQSLIKGDMKGIERYSRRLSAGDLYPLFACVLTGRSWTSVNAGISQTPVTQSEDVEIRTNATLYLPQISELLNRVPRQMLLLLKTNDLLRGIETILQTRASSSSFISMSRCCTRAIARPTLDMTEGKFWINYPLFFPPRLAFSGKLPWLAIAELKGEARKDGGKTKKCKVCKHVL